MANTETKPTLKAIKDPNFVPTPGTQFAILYALKARIASGLENAEPGSDQIPDSMGQVWTDASKYIDKLANTDPASAFQLGLTISLLPRNSGPKTESVYQWMRGDGPIILAKDELRPLFLNYLDSNPAAGQLVTQLGEYMNFDITRVKPDEVFSQPDCFLAVASLYLGVKLADTGHQSAETLHQLAIAKLANPRVSEIVRIYHESPDTAWLVDELEPFLSKLSSGESHLLTKIAHKTLDRTPPNAKIIALIDTIQNHELFNNVWTELSQAVGLLNRHIAGEEIQTADPVVLNYADDMKRSLKKNGITSLPTPDDILLQARSGRSVGIIRHLIHVFNKTANYQFLTDYDTQKALYGEAMAVYGKLLLELHPLLKPDDIQGASTLEEMFAVLRFNGVPTNCFEVSRDWFAEEVEGTPGVDGPGFSRSLVNKVNTIPPLTT